MKAVMPTATAQKNPTLNPVPIDRDALPQLKPDGATVRFESNRDYQRHFGTYLCRGLLVTHVDDAAIAEQTILSLQICGLQVAVELWARLIGRENGVAAFAIDNIDQHKALLGALADDVPLLI